MDNQHHGFQFEPTKPDHWVMGSGKATERFGGSALMPYGHGWQASKPEAELQSKNNFETMACTIFGSLNAWETLAKFLGFTDFPSNCSDRFNAIIAGITPQGGSPQGSAESIRKTGTIPEAVLPFSENIYDWAQFYSPDPMTQEYLALAKTITDKFILGYELVFNGVAAGKPNLLKSALARGPVCVSMFAWKINQATGNYFKASTDTDNHWVQVLDYVDGKYWIIFDQYEPFIKYVDWNTDFQTSMVYFLSRNNQIDILTQIRNLCLQVIGLYTQLIKKKLGFKV